MLLIQDNILKCSIHRRIAAHQIFPIVHRNFLFEDAGDGMFDEALVVARID
jgi:hypothetical protein